MPPHLKSWVGTCPHCPHGSYATVSDVRQPSKLAKVGEAKHTIGGNKLEVGGTVAQPGQSYHPTLAIVPKLVCF